MSNEGGFFCCREPDHAVFPQFLACCQRMSGTRFIKRFALLRFCKSDRFTFPKQGQRKQYKNQKDPRQRLAVGALPDLCSLISEDIRMHRQLPLLGNLRNKMER